MHERFRDRVEFFVVYIREAHPTDSARPDRETNIASPRTLEERAEVATTCSAALELGAIPLLIDGMDDATERAYSAWPDRLFLVDAEGKVAFAGAQGPRGFVPEELEAAITRLVGR
jgi:hypothetical protein